MPKEMEVELDNGDKVKIRSLKRGETKRLRKECGIRYDPASKGVVGDFEAYEDRMVAASIVTPETLRDLKNLDEIDDIDFNKLKTAVYSLAGLNKNEKDFLS